MPRVQSFGTEVAANATAALTWSNLRPGTYLIESGTHPSIQAPMGLYGILVVTTPAAGTTPAQAFPTVAALPVTSLAVSQYDADLPLVLSEIDPVQNASVDAAVATPGFSETAVWSGLPNGCGNPASASFNTCYPPAVNYSPRYYLVNGVSFDRTKIASSTAQILAAPATADHRQCDPAPRQCGVAHARALNRQYADDFACRRRQSRCRANRASRTKCSSPRQDLRHRSEAGAATAAHTARRRSHSSIGSSASPRTISATAACRRTSPWPAARLRASDLLRDPE